MKRSSEMMKRSMVLLAVSALAVGMSSEAALIAYEGFDYSTGSLSGQNGGDGWTGAWTSGDAYSVVGNSLTMPNLPFATTGGSAIGQNTINRNFTGIDFSVDAVYYSSFIMQRTGWGAADGSGEWFDFHFRTTSFARATAAGISSDEKFETQELGTAAKAGDAATTNPYFLVTKIVAHATAADEIYLKAYSITDTIDLTETASWTVTGGTEALDLLSNMVTLWAGADNDGDGLYQAAIDEIRIGTTWNDVIPEPSAFGLIAVAGGGLVFIRKRFMM